MARSAVGTEALDDERNGIHAKPGNATRQPEGDDPSNFVADAGAVHIQIGFVFVEPVVIPRGSVGIPAPRLLLKPREDQTFPSVSRPIGGPDVVLAIRRARIGARRL